MAVLRAVHHGDDVVNTRLPQCWRDSFSWYNQ